MKNEDELEQLNEQDSAYWEDDAVQAEKEKDLFKCTSCNEIMVNINYLNLCEECTVRLEEEQELNDLKKLMLKHADKIGGLLEELTKEHKINLEDIKNFIDDYLERLSQEIMQTTITQIKD